MFTRHPANPLLTAADLPYPASSCFNPAAVEVAGEVVLLMRVEDRAGRSHLTAAWSRDGVGGWRIDPAPTLAPDPARPEERWGVEDGRITRLVDGRLAVTYTGYAAAGPLVCLALTDDLVRFDRRGPILGPEDKDAALFPAPVGGRWACLHRPVLGPEYVRRDLWISYSDDLRHWGDGRPLLPARRGCWWDADKIGAGPPPLLTEHGWLVGYHGVKATIAGGIYRFGLALLDRDDPTRLLARGHEWLLAPEADYERVGDVPNVVFPCGWIVRDGVVHLYYGGADSCVCLATAPLADLLATLT